MVGIISIETKTLIPEGRELSKAPLMVSEGGVLSTPLQMRLDRGILHQLESNPLRFLLPNEASETKVYFRFRASAGKIGSFF